MIEVRGAWSVVGEQEIKLFPRSSSLIYLLLASSLHHRDRLGRGGRDAETDYYAAEWEERVDEGDATMGGRSAAFCTMVIGWGARSRRQRVGLTLVKLCERERETEKEGGGREDRHWSLKGRRGDERQRMISDGMLCTNTRVQTAVVG